MSEELNTTPVKDIPDEMIGAYASVGNHHNYILQEGESRNINEYDKGKVKPIRIAAINEKYDPPTAKEILESLETDKQQDEPPTEEKSPFSDMDIRSLALEARRTLFENGQTAESYAMEDELIERIAEQAKRNGWDNKKTDDALRYFIDIIYGEGRKSELATQDDESSNELQSTLEIDIEDERKAVEEAIDKGDEQSLKGAFNLLQNRIETLEAVSNKDAVLADLRSLRQTVWETLLNLTNDRDEGNDSESDNTVVDISPPADSISGDETFDPRKSWADYGELFADREWENEEARLKYYEDLEEDTALDEELHADEEYGRKVDEDWRRLLGLDDEDHGNSSDSDSFSMPAASSGSTSARTRRPTGRFTPPPIVVSTPDRNDEKESRPRRFRRALAVVALTATLLLGGSQGDRDHKNHLNAAATGDTPIEISLDADVSQSSDTSAYGVVESTQTATEVAVAPTPEATEVPTVAPTQPAIESVETSDTGATEATEEVERADIPNESEVTPGSTDSDAVVGLLPPNPEIITPGDIYGNTPEINTSIEVLQNDGITQVLQKYVAGNNGIRISAEQSYDLYAHLVKNHDLYNIFNGMSFFTMPNGDVGIVDAGPAEITPEGRAAIQSWLIENVLSKKGE